MKSVCLFLIRGYQAFLGPFLGGNCRFYPSCSHYAAEAIERHGARRGTALAVHRLLRCHPFSSGGVDLVPEESELSARVGTAQEPTDSERVTVAAGGRPARGEFAR
jgi:putative membrane protein insertion efficiency factor